MIRPLHDRVIVKRKAADEQTASGIIIPDTAKEKPQEGEVIAVGKGKVQDNGEIRPLDVQTGNKVLFSKYAGNDITVDDQEYIMMREDDILGIIE